MVVSNIVPLLIFSKVINCRWYFVKQEFSISHTVKSNWLVHQAWHSLEIETRWKCSNSVHSWNLLSQRKIANEVPRAPATSLWGVAKSLAWQNIAERPCKRSFPCWFCVSFLPFVTVRASLHVTFVCGLDAIVWRSVGNVLASAVELLLTEFEAILA